MQRDKLVAIGIAIGTIALLATALTIKLNWPKVEQVPQVPQVPPVTQKPVANK